MKEMIFDRIRKKYVTLTPEEQIRQKMVLFLTREKKFPESLLSIERKIVDNTNIRSLRTDIVVYEKDSHTPFILVECKSEKVKITHQAVEQIMEYNSLINAKFLVLTNGKGVLCFENENGKYRLTKIPNYNN